MLKAQCSYKHWVFSFPKASIWLETPWENLPNTQVSQGPFEAESPLRKLNQMEACVEPVVASFVKCTYFSSSKWPLASKTLCLYFMSFPLCIFHSFQRIEVFTMFSFTVKAVIWYPLYDLASCPIGYGIAYVHI